MERLGMEEGEPIEHNLISRAIENAQRKVEGHNFDIRKQLIEYDDVMNQQREVIYRQRREALSGEDLKPVIMDMIEEQAENISARFAESKTPAEEWDLKSLNEAVFDQFNFRLTFDDDTLDGLTGEGLAQMIMDTARETYEQKENAVGKEDLRQMERFFMLQTVDNLWKDHLLAMDHLKEGIGLRGYAQQNPLIVYKKEGFDMFNDMISRVKEDTLKIMFRIQVVTSQNIDNMKEKQAQNLVFSHGEEPQKKEPVKREGTKVGRNSPCPCGSGKKFKKCCGQ
jgi:preprotein translocase subunit SecA